MRRFNLITPDRLVLLGAILAAAAYIQDIRYDLILDDIPLILMNETITSWRNWKVLFVSDAFAGYNGSYFGLATVHYRPIYRLWQMLNEQMFGSVTPWWHITSLLTDQRWPRKATAIASVAIVAVLLTDLAVEVPRFSDNTSLYTSALKLAPRSFHLHAYYAAALAGYGRTEESIREYKITTELEPHSAATHEWYGGALADAGRDAEALVEYQKALELSAAAAPFRAYILSRMADLELKHSEFEDAAVHLRAAVQISPESPDYHASLARALNHQGRAEEAKEQLRLEATLRQRAAEERRASSN